MSELNEIQQKLRRVFEARQERDTTKTAAERAEKAYRRIESETWDELEEGPMRPPYKVDIGSPYGVVSFHPKETYYGRVIDAEKAIEYFEKRALVDEFTESKISKSRLNELVREKMEQGEQMPDGVDFYPRRFITITRPKGG